MIATKQNTQYCNHCQTTHLPEDPTIEIWIACPLCGDACFQLTRRPVMHEAFDHDLLVGGLYRQTVPPCASCGQRCMVLGTFKSDLVIIRNAVNG